MNKNKSINVFFVSIVILSIIGVTGMLINDPVRLVRYVVTTAIFAGLIFLIDGILSQSQGTGSSKEQENT